MIIHKKDIISLQYAQKIRKNY